MKQSPRFASCAVVLLAAFILPGCTPDDGFVPLFNGRDLDGWVNVNGAPSTWTVRDDMIVCSGIPTGVLRTTEQYENFILELEWRHLHPGGNAGLFVYSDALTARGKPFTRSVECQIMDGNHGDVFAIHGATMTPDRPHPQGWMRCLPSEERAHPAGQWNHYRVESRDGRLTLAVNGKVVSGASQALPRKGYICLESEGAEVHFRNIRLKELPSSNPPPEAIATVDEGFVSLYNGVDLTGWQTTSATPWTANDWILAYAGDVEDPSPLWTDRAFGDFVLIADWRMEDREAAQTSSGAAILIRGHTADWIDISNAATGSGGLFGEDASEQRPVVNADHPLGDWNRFIITVQGDHLSVVLNDQRVLDQVRLPALPEHGPIGLVGQDVAIAIANLYLKELP